MALLRDLWLWFWRLAPANPILLRVVSMGGKRTRHLAVRCAYLAALFAVMWLMGGGGLFSPATSLADLAKQSTQTFMWVSLAQLALMSFIAPVFCAAAITQEKDSNTYHILLTTPLTNGQIVLGSLLSRLYFVWVLLLSGLPIFCITMIYGGVTTAEVFESFALAACTGLVTGALAIMISVLKIGTRRTIFSFFLGIALYLLALGALGISSWTAVKEAPIGAAFMGDATTHRQMSWLAPLHPFLALFVVTGQTPAPAIGEVARHGFPARWFLAYPQYGYMVLTTLASAGMIVLSLFFLRSGAREGEATGWTRLRAFLGRPAAELRRKPRRVWKNPIAWREATTRASAAGRSALRWVFIAGGVAAAVGLAGALGGLWGGLNPDQVRSALTALVWIELGVILLVVTNTAATTLTREKETQTIELLLCTPLTSQYIIAGMLQGLVRFALPLIAAPTIAILLLTLMSLTGGNRGLVPIEAAVLAPVQMVAFTALAAMIGLQFSLTSKRMVAAVMLSTMVVLGAAGVLSGCGVAMGQASPMIAAVVLPFTPFPAMSALINVQGLLDVTMNPTPELAIQVRVARGMMSLIASAAYLAITISLYHNLVRGFDMTLRRQSA